MLGHQVVRQLASAYEVVTTVRKPAAARTAIALEGSRIISGFDVRVPHAVSSLLLAEKPQVVVNAVGIVKQRDAAVDALESIEVNSLFPHHLANACHLVEAHLIHISTDCVFSGEKGSYTEADNPDPIDLYGRSKLLGEVSAPGCLTIRTSMIGLELANYSSLVEWFLRQDGEVHGYTRSIWSGLTTAELARVIHRLVERHRDLDGVWHVSGQPISKYRLLAEFAALLGRPSTVLPDDSVIVDRSLNSDRFRAAVAYDPPGWDQMLRELATAVLDRENRAVV
jgi:dTDP-4-dehydrorhamnose reductase